MPPWKWRKRKERCTAVLGAGIHAVNAIVTEGLNRERIEPPQPPVSFLSTTCVSAVLTSPALTAHFVRVFPDYLKFLAGTGGPDVEK
jgi:hypothetical protein